MLSNLASSFGRRCLIGRYQPIVQAQRSFSSAAVSNKVEKRAARRAKREALKAKASSKQAKGDGSFKALLVVAGGSAAIFGAAYLHEFADDDNPLKQYYKGSILESAMKQVDAYLLNPFAAPAHEKLLPDWPMPGIPPDMPQPLVLVLDLEDTLVRMTWDRKYGWRYAKRPGVDKFLFDLARYYEIVLFTSTMAGIADPVVCALDKDGYIMHRLYRDATHFHKGKHVKDLSNLNRPIEKIIVIDDDPEAFGMQPENGIHIKPYLDATDKHDTALDDLKPFLEALVIEQVKNVPDTLRSYGSHKADEIVEEHKRRVAAAKAQQYEEAQKGLGGLIRSRRGGAQKPTASTSGILSSADIVKKGMAPSSKEEEAVPAQPERKKGRLWQKYSQSAKDAEEQQRIKMEAWQKVMEKKELERQKREAGSS